MLYVVTVNNSISCLADIIHFNIPIYIDNYVLCFLYLVVRIRISFSIYY